MGGIFLPDIKAHYIAKLSRQCGPGGETENLTENPQHRPTQICSNDFEKGTKSIQWRKDSFCSEQCWQLDIHKQVEETLT